MAALDAVASWDVAHAAAAVVGADGTVLDAIGDVDRRFELASITKVLSGWTAMVAVEEASVGLDQPAGQPGCTLRHLLAHAGGYPFDGPAPVAPPGRRRIYSNTGIELAAATIAEATGIAFADYLAEAVLEPLAMTSTTLDGSPARGAHQHGRRPRQAARRTATAAPDRYGVGRPPPPRFSIPHSPVSFPEWGDSIRARGDWASRSAAARNRTGPGRRTRRARSATSAGPER